MGLFSSFLPIAASVLSGGNPLGSIASSALGFMGQQNTNQSNQDIASANNATSVDLATHGIQYKVADYKAAGLNPALAYNTGPINLPSLSTPVMQNSAAAGIDAGLKSNQQALLQSQVETQKSQAQLNSAQADLAGAQAGKVRLDSIMSGIDAARGTNLMNAGQTIVDIAKQGAQQWQADADTENLKRLVSSYPRLDQVANSLGYGNFVTAVRNTDFQKSLTDLSLAKSDLPRASALSDFYKGDFGRSIAPYLNSAKDLTSIGSGVVGTGINLFKH